MLFPISAAEVRPWCEIPHILTKGGSVFFLWKRNCRNDFFLMLVNVGASAICSISSLYLLTVRSDASPEPEHHVWGLENHMCKRLIFDHSIDIMFQESRQAAGLEMAQGRLCVCVSWQSLQHRLQFSSSSSAYPLPFSLYPFVWCEHAYAPSPWPWCRVLSRVSE